MSYRDRDPRDYRPGNPEFEESRPDRYGPDQYGQEHYGRRQYNPQHQAEAGPAGQSQFGYRQPGYSQSGPGQYGQSRHEEPRGWQSRDDWRGRDTGGWQSRDRSGDRPEWRGGDARDAGPGRDSREWSAQASRHDPSFSAFSQEPSGHAPFSHSAFGESNQPRYFGTGSQGHGGGPTFTGGTYGQADWRSDSPYFDEVGFNRGNYEDPIGRERNPRPASRQGQQQRRYPEGPKGYTRSDDRLREDISERLMQSYDIDSSDVTVQVSGGKVVLEGTVPSRHMKHAIEDVADAAPGVQDVDNRIRVKSARGGWGGAADAGSLSQTADNPVASGVAPVVTGESSNASATSSTASNGRTTRRDS